MRRSMRERTASAMATLVVLLAASFATQAEEIVTVSGRQGETQSYLLMNYPRPKVVAVQAVKNWMLGRAFSRTID